MSRPNISKQNTLHASQSIGPNWRIQLSHESDAETFIGGNGINVQGVAYLFVYNTSGGPCTFGAHATPGAATVPLYTEAGVVVSVATATAQLVDVRGCHFVTPSATVTVIYAA
jgi:hypothetical protein